MSKQNDSKYHILYLEVKSLFTFEDNKHVLNLIKELYQEHEELLQDKDDDGKYGIRYATIDHDSFYKDKHIKFFRNKELRDNVFSDWKNEQYWDDIMDIELQYPYPRPHLCDIEKVFKEGNFIYEEKTESDGKL